MIGKAKCIDTNLKSHNIPSFMKVEPKVFGLKGKKKSIEIMLPPSP